MVSTTLNMVPGSDSAWEQGFRKFKAAQFIMGANGTLASDDLEEGDAYPYDADYEIISSKITHGRNLQQVAEVVAMKEVTV